MIREVLILVDADVLIHLYKAEKVSLLNELFPKRVRMLDIVLSELKDNRTIRDSLDSIFTFSGIKEIIMPTTSYPKLLGEFLTFYKQEKKGNGKGECATLVYCKYNRHIIASSNTKDIIPYCTMHNLSYLTTLDILAIALHKGKISLDEIKECITKILHNNGSQLCCKDINSHIRDHFDTSKYLI